jgi:hypothetical protein
VIVRGLWLWSLLAPRTQSLSLRIANGDRPLVHLNGPNICPSSIISTHLSVRFFPSSTSPLYHHPFPSAVESLLTQCSTESRKKNPESKRKHGLKKKKSINFSVTTRRQRGSRAVFGTRNGRRSRKQERSNCSSSNQRRTTIDVCNICIIPIQPANVPYAHIAITSENHYTSWLSWLYSDMAYKFTLNYTTCSI